MRRFMNGLGLMLAALVVLTITTPSVRVLAQNVPCYMTQGGAGWHFGSGCTATVESGGILNVASGGALKIAGSTVTPTAAELNALASAGISAAEAVQLGLISATAAEINGLAGTGLDATELGFLNGISAGSITASKGVTRTAAQGIPFATAVVAALGANASNGAPLTKDINLVTGADNTTCAVLPVGVAGERITIVNTVGNKVLPVFPVGTEQINAGGAGVVFTMGPGRAATFVSTAASTWYVDVAAAATPNVTELALLTGAGTGGTPVASKVQVADANQNIGVVKATALHIGATGAEVEVTATPAELNTLNRAGATGVAEASKAVVLDANKAVDVVRTASLMLGATGAEVAVTATAANLNAVPTATGTGAEIDAQTKNVMSAASTAVLSASAAIQTCTITMKDADGNTIAAVQHARVYLSTDAVGTILASAANGTVAPTTGTILKNHTAKLDWDLLTDVNGVLVLSIDNTGGADHYAVYVNIVLPNGKVLTSLVTDVRAA